MSTLKKWALIALAPLLVGIASPKPSPSLPPAPPPCLLLMQMTGVSDKKITPENIGKLYGAALTLRVETHKGTPLQGMFTKDDLRGAADDLSFCFRLKDQ